MENKLGKTWLVMKTVIITVGIAWMIGTTEKMLDLDAGLVQQADRITATKKDVKAISDVIVNLHK